jgi:hypothetical protein
MAECARVPECDTAGSWCRVAPGVFISLKFGQSPFLLVGIVYVACDRKLMPQQPSSWLSRIVVGLTMAAMFGAAVAMFVYDLEQHAYGLSLKRRELQRKRESRCDVRPRPTPYSHSGNNAD